MPSGWLIVSPSPLFEFSSGGSDPIRSLVSFSQDCKISAFGMGASHWVQPKRLAEKVRAQEKGGQGGGRSIHCYHGLSCTAVILEKC